MARKSKTQPSPEAAPARQGRKPKVAALSAALPLATDVGIPTPGDAGSGVPQAGPTKAPGRRGAARKLTQAAGAKTALVIPDMIEDETPTAAAVSQAGAVAGQLGGNVPRITVDLDDSRALALAQLVKRLARSNLGSNGLNLASSHDPGEDYEMEQAVLALRDAMASAGFDPR